MLKNYLLLLIFAFCGETIMLVIPANAAIANLDVRPRLIMNVQ